MSQLKVDTIRHTSGTADNITLDNSQNVMVEGNATVDGTLAVTGATSFADDVIVKSTAHDPDNGAFDAANYPLVVQNPEDVNGDSTGIGFAVTTATDKIGAAIHHVREGGGSQGDMRFLVSSDGNSITERLRLTSAGFLKAKGDYADYRGAGNSYHELLGDGAGNVTLVVQAGSSSGKGINCYVNSDDTDDWYFAGYSLSTSSYRLYMWSNGNLVNNNNSYGSLSDIKLKENIVDASSQWNDIKNLKVRKFNFKDNPSKPMLGLIAQEAETVSPGLVDSHPDTDAGGDDLGTTTKSVKYSILYMKAIKALQEAMAKIETLETKVAALEAG